jgi:predicted ATPase
MPSNIGLKGENTAAVLNAYENEPVDYIPSDRFTQEVLEHDEAKSKQKATLKQAVEDWLRYLGLGKEIEITERPEGIYLRIVPPDSDVPQDLIHLGVGVSQVLPILVMCLLAQSGSTILLEQPELHLHPKVQAELGDFFISMALLDKQCIIETHGEHWLNRIRWRVAAMKQEWLRKMTNIYFMNRVEGATRTQQIRIDKFGLVSDWPQGFFDQAHLDAINILIAGALDENDEAGKD